MRRLLHPSGVFLCTVLGGLAKRTLLGPKEYGELAEAGYMELAGDDTRATLATRSAARAGTSSTVAAS